MDSLIGHILLDGFGPHIFIINKSTILNLDPALLCKLIFKIDNSNNCVCEGSESTINLPLVFVKDKLNLCSGEEISIGKLAGTNAIYQWNTALGLDCTQCPLAQFKIDNHTQNIQNYLKILTIDSPSGCRLLYQFDIDVLPVPSLLTGDVVMCLGDTLIAVATEAVKYVWSGPDIIFNNNQFLYANPDKNTSYNVEITNKNGCIGYGSFNVAIKSLSPFDISYDSIYCFGPNAQIHIKVDSSMSFTWLNGANRLSDLTNNNPFILISEDYNFVLEMRNDFCREVLNIPIRFKEIFTIKGIVDTTKICFGEVLNIVLDSAFSYSVEPKTFINCKNVSCSDFLINTSFLSQNFQITALDQNKCVVNRSFNVVTLESLVKNEAQFYLCNGDSLLIDGHTIVSPGVYCDTIRMENSSCIVINCNIVNQLPTIETNENIRICPGDVYVFDGNNLTDIGQYCKLYLSKYGCDSTFCLNLNFYDVNNNIDIPIEYTIKSGDEVLLEGPSGYESYLWSPSEGLSCVTCISPIANPISNMQYTLEVIDTNGCKAQAILRVNIIPKCIGSIKEIPNGFTPNNDGINDFYTLGDIFLCGPMTFMVFNRWGNKVFEQKNWDNNWNGNSNNGSELPQGTYYVAIEFVDQKVTTVGFVDLRKK